MIAPSSYGSLPTYVLRSPGVGTRSKFVSATALAIELMTDFCYEDPCVVPSERQIVGERECACGVAETKVGSEECQR